MTEHLAIKPAREKHQPGELVTGALDILEPVKAKTLTLTLEYRESTEDYRQIARGVTMATPLHEGPLAAGQSFNFSFQLPADALPNQSGQVGSLWWGLHSRIARFGADLHTWQTIHVGPGEATPKS
jgi:hypothetical protein